MNNVTKTLLKNGIKGLAGLEENYFKQNIIHALSFKLNESISELYKECSNKLLYNNEVTTNTNELKEFIDFVNNFEPGKYQFKNNSVLNITDSEIKAIKNLFEALNTNNRQKMVAEIFTDSETFKNHVNFYNQSQGLLK
jgi:hypothetical protein